MERTPSRLLSYLTMNLNMKRKPAIATPVTDPRAAATGTVAREDVATASASASAATGARAAASSESATAAALAIVKTPAPSTRSTRRAVSIPAGVTQVLNPVFVDRLEELYSNKFPYEFAPDSDVGYCNEDIGGWVNDAVEVENAAPGGCDAWLASGGSSSPPAQMVVTAMVLKLTRAYVYARGSVPPPAPLQLSNTPRQKPALSAGSCSTLRAMVELARAAFTEGCAPSSSHSPDADVSSVFVYKFVNASTAYDFKFVISEAALRAAIGASLARMSTELALFRSRARFGFPAVQGMTRPPTSWVFRQPCRQRRGRPSLSAAHSPPGTVAVGVGSRGTRISPTTACRCGSRRRSAGKTRDPPHHPTPPPTPPPTPHPNPTHPQHPNTPPHLPTSRCP